MAATDEGLAATDDLDPVMRTSHRLKGSLGMLAAHSAETAAKNLKHHAGSGEMEQARTPGQRYVPRWSASDLRSPRWSQGTSRDPNRAVEPPRLQCDEHVLNVQPTSG